MKTFKKHILVCTSEKPLHCAELGGLLLLQEFRKQVNERNLQNDFYVTKTGCTDQHSCGPTIIIYPDGIWYKEVKLSDIAEIIESHLLNGKIVERLLNKEIGLKK